MAIGMRSVCFLWLLIAATRETGVVTGTQIESGLFSKRNSFNSEANLQVDSNDWVPICYGKPCEPIKIPEDPRSQRVLVLLERCGL
jgi:hypothetical protein